MNIYIGVLTKITRDYDGEYEESKIYVAKNKQELLTKGILDRDIEEIDVGEIKEAKHLGTLDIYTYTEEYERR